MYAGGEKWFAPSIRWSEVDMAAAAFPAQLAARFERFYFGPAEFLLDRGNDFPAGVLLLSALDALARLLTGIGPVGSRFRIAATEIGITPADRERFYDDYRNGLLHEARIKSGACFDQSLATLLEHRGSELVVNPRLLLDAVRNLCGTIESDPIRFNQHALPLLLNDIGQG